MAVPDLILTRGLWLPDPRLIAPMGEIWSYGGFGAGDFQVEACDVEHGCGRRLVIDVSDALVGTHYLLSGKTPDEIAAGPSATAENFYVWVGFIGYTGGFTVTETNLIIAFWLQGYEFSAPDAVHSSKYLGTIYVGHGHPFPYALQQNMSTESYNAGDDFYRLKITFQKGTGWSGVNSLVLNWIGMGLPRSASLDAIDSSEYASDVDISSEGQGQAVDPPGTPAGFYTAENWGAQYQLMSLYGESFTDDEKRLINACQMWNTGMATDDAVNKPGRPCNRGTRQPVIIGIDRKETARAFYANMNRPRFRQSTRGWWPEDEGRWSATLNFTERL